MKCKNCGVHMVTDFIDDVKVYKCERCEKVKFRSDKNERER